MPFGSQSTFLPLQNLDYFRIGSHVDPLWERLTEDLTCLTTCLPQVSISYIYTFYFILFISFLLIYKKEVDR